jgi:Bacterial Ig domain
LALQNTAQDVGSSGRDSTFGFGLIRADRTTNGGSSGPVPQPELLPSPDTTAPRIKITKPAANADVPVGTVVVEGTSSDGGGKVKSVGVRLNDNTYATAIHKALGDWSTWTIDMNISAGSHRLVSRATDNTGNQAWSIITITTR